MTARDDAVFMRRALELAARGAGMVQPNPLVGAVLVSNGIVIGEGYHERYGGPHAEVNALRQAGAAARGATMYVTLEPCAHHGRTPPCTEALLAAGAARVVFAAADTNPVATGGASVLRAAGMDVAGGVLSREARRVNAHFHHWHEQGAPFITLKLAVSADNKLAAAEGQRTPITGAQAARVVHRMRAMNDAILVGIGTALIDDPLLTVRDTPVVRPPVRVIVDTDARLPLSSQLMRTIDAAPVWILCAVDAPRERVSALEAAGVRILRLPRTEHGLDLARGITALGAANLRSIFVEGGTAIGRTLLKLGLVQRLHLFAAPVLLGEIGVPAPVSIPVGAIATRGAELFGAAIGTGADDARALELTGMEQMGDDVLLTFDAPEYL